MNGAQPAPAAASPRPSKQKIEEQLDKIAQSETFRHAIALQRLLRYLASKAQEVPTPQIKEYTIGVEVFERGPDYDPKIDTSVRVQIHRLRLKLNEYYETEGESDQVFVELPKGSYLPGFKPRAAVTAAHAENHWAGRIFRWIGVRPRKFTGPKHADDSIDGEAQRKRRTRAIWPHRAVVGSISALIFVSGILLGIHWDRIPFLSRGDASRVLAGSLASGADDPARRFWADFLGSDRAPVVGFANAVYLEDGSSDLYRFRGGASDNRGTPVERHVAQQFAANPGMVAKAGPLFYQDGFSGTGDVESAVALTRLFTQMGLQITVKRCRTVTIDDLREHSVILLGSPDQNDMVEKLPQDQDFVFQHGNPPGGWGGRFMNLHPQPGEQPWYKAERDPKTQELLADYGVITIQPGVVPGRYIAILAGQDTSGVAGDALFMSSPTLMSGLINRLKALEGSSDNGNLPTFQALLRVDVEKGIDVLDVKLLAVHLIRPSTESALAQGSSESAASSH